MRDISPSRQAGADLPAAFANWISARPTLAGAAADEIARRFDYVIDVQDRDGLARRAIPGVLCRARRLADGVDLDALAEASDGMKGAELEALCRRASDP